MSNEAENARVTDPVFQEAGDPSLGNQTRLIELGAAPDPQWSIRMTALMVAFFAIALLIFLLYQ
jgi:hypothetical protein